jgi:hypothetical protein
MNLTDREKYYLMNLLTFELMQMVEAEVGEDFYEYKTLKSIIEKLANEDIK